VGSARPGRSSADTPVSRIAVFTDPDGNHVGLVSR
jgi:uncharacterized protein